MRALMPFRRLRVRQFYIRLLCALLAGLLPMVLGAGHRHLADRQRRETGCGGAAGACQSHVRPHPGQRRAGGVGPCRQPGQALSRGGAGLGIRVATVPDVRSVNLARVIPSTAPPSMARSAAVLAGRLCGGGRLDLMKGNPVTPNRPLIVYREAAGSSACWWGRRLLPAQHTGHAEPQLAPRAGGGAADAAAGQPAHRPAHSRGEPGLPRAGLDQISVQGGDQVSLNEYGAHIWDYSKVGVIFYPAGAAARGGVFWLTGRPTSPVQELKRALDQQEFIPYLQPVVTGDDAHWSGCEVLMRWQHPVRA